MLGPLGSVADRKRLAVLCQIVYTRVPSTRPAVIQTSVTTYFNGFVVSQPTNNPPHRCSRSRDTMGAAARFKSVDMYKKIPKDLTEATLSGATISLVAAIIMFLLLLLELSAFMRTQTQSELVVDMSPQNELLKVTFNISFPALSCEFASLDVSDALGKKRMNLTKTIHKTPITVDLDMAGPVYVEEQSSTKAAPKYDEEHLWWEHLDLTHPFARKDLELMLTHHPIVVVNFFAPWCHWCQRLEPAWEAATAAIQQKYPEATDGRIAFVKVDCTAEVQLCREHFVTGFPSIRVFRKAHDDIYVNGQHQHESYTGDRTKEALEKFADTLVLSAGQPHVRHADLTEAPRVAGCNIAGFVLVKKVPGTLHFTAKDEHHSFDHAWMNMTHVIHSFHFGTQPSLQKHYMLKRLHPMGLKKDWLDKLQEQRFFSLSPQHTHEHYLQVVRTTIQPLHGGRGASYDAYEYVAHSHTYMSDHQPTAKFSYDLSALQVVVKEQPKHWYKFLTTTCAVIGGVFTVAGILDGALYSTLNLKRKVELGKHG